MFHSRKGMSVISWVYFPPERARDERTDTLVLRTSTILAPFLYSHFFPSTQMRDVGMSQT